MTDKSYLTEVVCECIGMLAAASAMNDITEIKRVCAAVEKSLRVDVLPEVSG